jgi:hypothetical protein
MIGRQAVYPSLRFSTRRGVARILTGVFLDHFSLDLQALRFEFCYNVDTLLHRGAKDHGHYKTVEPRV